MKPFSKKQFAQQDRGIILTDNTGTEMVSATFMKIFSESLESTDNIKWVNKPIWSFENYCPFTYIPVGKDFVQSDNLYLFRTPSAIRRDFDLDDLNFPFTPIAIIVFVELNNKYLWKNQTIHLTKKTGFYWVAKSKLPCVIGVLEAEPHVVTMAQMIDIVKIPPRVPIIADHGSMNQNGDEVTDDKLRFANACVTAVLELTNGASSAPSPDNSPVPTPSH